MKICLYNVTTTLKIGGIETFYWEIAKELQNRDIKLEIIAGKGNYIKYNDIPLKMFDFTPRNKILDLGSRFKKWGERISFFKNAYPYLKKQKYDIFLIHKPLDFFTAYFMKRDNPNLKTIFVSGGEDFYGFDKFFSKYIDYMFAVSSENKKIIENRYKREVYVLHNGVDINIFKPIPEIRKKMREKYNLNNKKVLISVGRIVALKGYQLVIDVLNKLDDKYIYVIIGNGEYLKTLKQQVQKLQLEKKVIFLGEIDNNELVYYLNMADVFIQPTISHEAFGITLIEAMACNIPVIASYNGGMKDIIDEDSGLFFEIKNLKDLKDKIEKVFNLNLNPRKRVIENFTWEKTVNTLLLKIGVV